MHAWESIQTTVNRIENSLSEQLDIETLAAEAHLSPFYYQRLFTRLVGKPVMEYVKLRRLARAADDLAANKKRILDTALDFGFESHETFTRAFREAYGLTPEEYRGSPRPMSHFIMPDLSLKYSLVEENVPLMADGVLLEVTRQRLESPRYYTGHSVQNPVSDTPGIDYLDELWGRFKSQILGIQHTLPGGNTLGVSFAGRLDGCFTYFVGVETADDARQEDYENWMLPVGDYVICTLEAENFYLLTTNALNKARDYMLGVWLPHRQLAIEPFMAELYGDTEPDATTMELWFQLKP